METSHTTARYHYVRSSFLQSNMHEYNNGKLNHFVSESLKVLTRKKWNLDAWWVNQEISSLVRIHFFVVSRGIILETSNEVVCGAWNPFFHCALSGFWGVPDPYFWACSIYKLNRAQTKNVNCSFENVKTVERSEWMYTNVNSSEEKITIFYVSRLSII